jgi:hypothetical protein
MILLAIGIWGSSLFACSFSRLSSLLGLHLAACLRRFSFASMPISLLLCSEVKGN